MAQNKGLPLPDYDELPLASLQHQVRSLEAEDLRILVAHEREHANRTPVLEVLNTRLTQLAEGAVPSGGDQQSGTARPPDTPTGSPVSPDSAAKPSGPLRHGIAGPTPDRDKP